MTLGIYVTSEGKQVIAESAEAKAWGWQPTTPPERYNDPRVLLGTGTISKPLGVVPKDVIVEQGIGYTTYYSEPAPKTSGAVIKTEDGIEIPISAGVLGKIQEAGGLQNIYQKQYMMRLQAETQALIGQAVRLVSEGKDVRIFATPEEKTKWEAEQKAYDLMLTERAERTETLLWGTVKSLGIEQAMKGYAGLGVILTGGDIEQARRIELEQRKAYVGQALQQPLLVVVELGQLGISLFTITGTASKFLTASSIGKPFYYSLASYTAFQSSSLVGQTLIETKTKGLTFETGGKLLMGAAGVAGAFGMSYMAHKLPTIWSATKWQEPTVKFEGESKSFTVGTADFEKNIMFGKTISSVSQKGVQSAYWGIVKKEIFVKSFPETTFTGSITGRFGTGESFTPSITFTRTTLFGRFPKEVIDTSTIYTKSYFTFQPKIETTLFKTGKTLEDYLKGFTVKEFKSGELPSELKGHLGIVKPSEKVIMLDTEAINKAGISKEFVIKHEILHTLYPEADIDFGYTQKTFDVTAGYQFEKSGTISFAKTTEEPKFDIRSISESWSLKGLDIRYLGITGSETTSTILNTITRPLIESQAQVYKTEKGGTISFGIPKESEKFMLQQTRFASTGTTFTLKEIGEGYQFKPIGTYRDIGVGVMKMPVIAMASGGGGLSTFTSLEGDLGLGLGGSSQFDIIGLQTVLPRFEGLRQFGLYGGVFGVSQPRYRNYEETTYLAYPPVSNIVTNTTQGLGLSLVTKQAEGLGLNIDTTLGTKNVLGLAQNLGVGLALGTTTVQSTSQIVSQSLDQSQLTGQLQAQSLIQGLNLNISVPSMITVPYFTFDLMGGMLPTEAKSRRKGRKLRVPKTAIDFIGTPLADLLSVTQTEATLLSIGKEPIAIHPSGKLAMGEMFKSGGLRVPTVQMIKGFGTGKKLRLW